jgi:hypothetical protein
LGATTAAEKHQAGYNEVAAYLETVEEWGAKKHNDLPGKKYYNFKTKFNL